MPGSSCAYEGRWFSSCDPFCTQKREADDEVAGVLELSWASEVRSSFALLLIVAYLQGRPAILPLVVAKTNPN